MRLIDTGDRLGGILSTHIAGLLYAHHHNILIEYDRTRYDDSIFMKSLYDWTKIHNLTAVVKDVELVSERDWYRTMIHTLKTIKIDYVSYFYMYLRESVCTSLNQYAIEKNYQIPFNPHKTILVHLRLNDVRSLPDYEGRICNDEYMKLINADRYEECAKMCPNRQSPLSMQKLERLIKTATGEFPDREVILLTSPGEQITLPYRVISNQDESLDMYLLCKSDVVILSRSTFSLVTLLFGDSKQVYSPGWCHSACMGLTTKFDRSASVSRTVQYYS
jgi:hypothetical protein